MPRNALVRARARNLAESISFPMNALQSRAFSVAEPLLQPV